LKKISQWVLEVNILGYKLRKKLWNLLHCM